MYVPSWFNWSQTFTEAVHEDFLRAYLTKEVVMQGMN